MDSDSATSDSIICNIFRAKIWIVDIRAKMLVPAFAHQVAYALIHSDSARGHSAGMQVTMP